MTQDRVRPIPVGSEPRMNRGAHIEPKDAIRFFLRHYRVILVTLVLFWIGAVVEHRLLPEFNAKSTIFVDRTDVVVQTMTQRLQGMNMTMVDGREGAAGDTEKYIRYMQSYEFFLSVARDLKKAGLDGQLAQNIQKPRKVKDLLFRPSAPPPDQDASGHYDLYLGDALQTWTKYSPIGTDGISVQVSSPDKELSRTLADMIASSALAWISRTEIRQLNSAVGYLDVKIKESEDKIAQLEEELVTFKRVNRILSLYAAAGPGANNTLEATLHQTEAQFDENQRLLSDYKARLEKQKAEISAILLANKHEGLDKMVYKTNLAQKIAEAEQTGQVLMARIKSFQHQINDQLKGKSFLVEQEAFEFQKKFELQYNLFQDLMREKFRIELNRISVENRMRNITKAEYSEVLRSTSLTKKMLFALVAALVIASALCYLLDLFFPVVKSRHDLSEMGFTFIGGIPNFRTRWQARNASLYQRIDNRVVKIFRFEADHQSVTSLFKLRSKILHQLTKINRDHAVVAFMGANAGEGKTFTATNCAAAIAMSGRKVLLIDADLRARGTSRVFGIEKRGGLAEVMENQELYGQLVIKNLLPKLDVLPAGQANRNPASVFTNQNFKEVVEKLSHLYDFVILDTPAILLVPETIEIEKSSHLNIFVTSFNQTRIDEVLRACDSMLDFAHGSSKNLAVLNLVDPRHDHLVLTPSSHYYYGHGIENQV
jgi:capsular exopolysaccharide synthesis family protein